MSKNVIRLFCAFLVVLLSGVLLTACREQASSDSPGDDRPYSNTESSPSPAANDLAVQTWQDVYADYLTDRIPTSEIDIDALPEGSEEKARFDAFIAGEYPIVPFFYLYDIDKNGTPELIYIDFTYDFYGDVFTVIDDSIVKLGIIEFYPFGNLGVPIDKQIGLYSDVGYKGHYGEVLYYTIENGAIVRQVALQYNNQPDVSPEHAGAFYDFHNYERLDYYEVTEANVSNVILDGI